MLRDKIQEDLKQAMMAKDELKLSTVRMLKSAIQYHEIQKGADRAERGSSPASKADRRGESRYEATDDDVIEVIGREIKKRNEAIDLYKRGGREELAQKEEKELEILKAYLPEQMSEDEVRNIVKQVIVETGASTVQEMGKVMATLMPKVKGKADGTFVSNLVREQLTK